MKRITGLLSCSTVFFLALLFNSAPNTASISRWSLYDNHGVLTCSFVGNKSRIRLKKYYRPLIVLNGVLSRKHRSSARRRAIMHEVDKRINNTHVFERLPKKMPRCLPLLAIHHLRRDCLPDSEYIDDGSSSFHTYTTQPNTDPMSAYFLALRDLPKETLVQIEVVDQHDKPLGTTCDHYTPDYEDRSDPKKLLSPPVVDLLKKIEQAEGKHITAKLIEKWSVEQFKNAEMALGMGIEIDLCYNSDTICIGKGAMGKANIVVRLNALPASSDCKPGSISTLTIGEWLPPDGTGIYVYRIMCCTARAENQEPNEGPLPEPPNTPEPPGAPESKEENEDPPIPPIIIEQPHPKKKIINFRNPNSTILHLTVDSGPTFLYNESRRRFEMPVGSGFGYFVIGSDGPGATLKNESAYQERKEARQARDNEEFKTHLARDHNAASSCNRFLNTITTRFAQSFGNLAHSLVDQQRSQLQLLNMRWPEDLPRNNELYYQFCELKHALLECEFNSDGSPKPTDSSYKRNYQRAQILSNFYKYTLSEKAYHEKMQKGIRDGVLCLKRVYQEELNRQPRSTGQVWGNVLTMMATEPFKFAWDTLKYLAGTPTLAEKIRNHPLNRDTQQYINYIDQGDYKNAFEFLYNRYLQTHNSRYLEMVESARQEFFRTHNKYGVPRDAENDPLFVNYPEERKEVFKNFLAQIGQSLPAGYIQLTDLHELTRTLERRARAKNTLAEKMGINEDNRTAPVDKLLYKILEHGEHTITVNHVLQELAHLSADSEHQEDRETYKKFFDNEGLCKLLSSSEPVKKLTKNIRVDNRINLAENADVRTLANCCAALAMSKPEHAKALTNAIVYCSKASESPECKQVYEKLAVAEITSCLATTNDPFSKCGNFAERLPTSEQRDLQHALAMQAATCLEDSSGVESQEACYNRLTHLALLETARQLNSEGKTSLAEQALELVNQIPTGHHTRAIKLVKEEQRISAESDSFERACSYEICDTSPTRSAPHDTPHEPVHKEPPAPTPPTHPEQQPPAEPHDTSQRTPRVPPHDTQRPPSTPFPENRTPSRASQHAQELKHQVRRSSYLSSSMRNTLAKFNDVSRNLGVRSDQASTSKSSELHDMSNLAKLAETNPQAFEDEKAALYKKINELVTTIAQELVVGSPEDIDSTLKPLFTDDNQQLTIDQQSYDAIKQLCQTAKWLCDEGFVQAGKQLAELALKAGSCTLAFGEGVAEGVLAGYESMFKMLCHPIDTASEMGSTFVACMRFLEYAYVRQEFKESLQREGRFDEFDELWKNAKMPAHIRETEQMLDPVLKSVAEKITHFVETAPLEEWCKIPGRFVGEALAWHYNLLKIAQRINELTGLGAQATQLIERTAQSLIDNGLNDRLLRELEEFGMRAEELDRIISVAQKGSEPELHKEMSKLVETLAQRISVLEKSLTPASVAQEIKNLQAAGRPIESYLEEVGRNLKKVGTPNTADVHHYLEELQVHGLTQQQTEQIAQAAQLPTVVKGERAGAVADEAAAVMNQSEIPPNIEVKHCEGPTSQPSKNTYQGKPTAVIDETICPTKLAEEIKNIYAAGKNAESCLEEAGKKLVQYGLSDGIESVEKFRNKLKSDLVGKLGDENAALKQVEMLFEKAYEEVVARDKQGLKSLHVSEIVDEMHQVNVRRSQRGEEIDFSNYKLNQQEQKVMQNGYEEFKSTPGATNKEGPINRVVKAGLEGSSTECPRGSIYEIQEALEVKKEGEEVINLGIKYDLKEKRMKPREFDIETPTKLIECKNIEWPDLKNYHNFSEAEKKFISDRMTTFCQQKLIAKGWGKEFEVRSATAIPYEWKEFFNKHNIKFIERCLNG